LPDVEQALFRRLGVFASGFTLEAAEAVVPDDGDAETRGRGDAARRLPVSPPPRVSASEILDGLAALVDKSLVSHETGAGGDSRYVMLHTIREYALTRLRAAGEEDAASIQHLDFCVRRAETAEQALRGGEQLTWLARLDE